MTLSEAAAWAAVIATLLAVVVALLKEELQALWRRPKLAGRIRLSAPDCHKTELTFTNRKTGEIVDHCPCYYFRIWVENIGNLRAKQVQVFVSRLLRKHADGTFKEDQQFVPMNLRWAHTHEVFTRGISAKMGRHCDIGYIVPPDKTKQAGHSLPGVQEGKTIMHLDLEVAPNTRTHLLGPGTYQLLLQLAAENSKPVLKTLELTLTGDWHDDEARMFSDAVGLRDVS